MKNMLISDVAYELYKQNWIDTHTTPQLRLQVINDYYNYIQEIMEDEDCDDLQEYDSLEEYIYDNGYPNGEMYVCFDEFLDNEFQDKEYMKKLLGVVLYADYLLDLDHMNK
jgi:hypothetical protein